ncbi:MAG TPA: hypothetical protein VGG89_08085 [Candidatus Baltobacteraceae bacterium]
MIAYRAFLAGATALAGVVVAVRTLAFGVRIETLPGIVLGAAMVVLGVHRLSLIVRARKTAP